MYGRDVLATWKVLVSLGVTPVLYVTYTVLATWYVRRHTHWKAVHKRLMPLYTIVGLPIISYSTLKFAEVGLQVAGGVPLMCGEPEDWSTFRLGLFGLDKLGDVDGTVSRLAEGLDRALAL